MKQLLTSVLLCMALLVACKDNNANLGNTIKPRGDSIYVCTDTFHLQTSNYFVDSAFLQNDTLLLGEVYSQAYGSTKADILFQVAPPINYQFPKTDTESIKEATPDSMVMYIYYHTWYGSGNSPLEFCLYEVDKKSIDYSAPYFSNIDIDEYVTVSDANLVGKKVMTPVNYSLPDSVLSDTTYIPSIRYHLGKQYAEHIFNLPQEAFASIEAFQEHFKGFYLTTDYGSSTMLHLAQIDFRLYYHYIRTYQLDGEQHTDTVSTWVNFPVNGEVRQLNRIVHDDIANVKANLNAIDSLCFIKSPCGIYTDVTIPIGKILSRVDNTISTSKMLSINSAEFKLEIVNDNAVASQLGCPEYLLLVNKTNLTDYFVNKYVPTSMDTTAVIGYYDEKTSSYNFDIAYLLNAKLKQRNLLAQQSDATPILSESDVLNMVALPIDAQLSNNTYITAVEPLFKVTGFAIRSGKNSLSPAKINIIYSGF